MSGPPLDWYGPTAFAVSLIALGVTIWQGKSARRSADAAERSEQAASRASRLALETQVVTLAREVVAESEQLQTQFDAAQRRLRAQFIEANALGGDRYRVHLAELEGLRDKGVASLKTAQAFLATLELLQNGTDDELSSKTVTFSAALVTIRNTAEVLRRS